LQTFGDKSVSFVSNLVLGLILVGLLVLVISYIVVPLLNKILGQTNVTRTTASFISTAVNGGLKIICALVFMDLLAAGFLTLTTFTAAFGTNVCVRACV
jgi:hypothetical protein